MAKHARAELLTEVSKGRHAGTAATVEQLYADWIVEFRRKGRSPKTVYGYRRPQLRSGSCCYFVVNVPVADARFPTPSRLSTWKKYGVLRARPLIVTECLVTSVRSRAVALL